METTTLKNLTDTKKFATKIANQLKGGEILLLQGDLGSGKTTFVKALAKALGIKKTVVSPTFTFCHQYTITPTSILPLRGRGRNFLPSSTKGGDKEGGYYLLHLDCYRLKTPKEFLELGVLEQIGQPDTITAIEWPEKIKKYLPQTGRILLQFSHGQKNNEKIVTFKNK